MRAISLGARADAGFSFPYGDFESHLGESVTNHESRRKDHE